MKMISILGAGIMDNADLEWYQVQVFKSTVFRESDYPGTDVSYTYTIYTIFVYVLHLSQDILKSIKIFFMPKVKSLRNYK